jgi:hypothetical protein
MVRISSLDIIPLHIELSYFRKEGPNGTNASGSLSSRLSKKKKQKFKSPKPKNRVEIKNTKTKMDAFPSNLLINHYTLGSFHLSTLLPYGMQEWFNPRIQ